MKLLFILPTLFLFVACGSEQKKDLPENFDFGTTENGHYSNDYFDLDIFFNPEWVVQDQQEMDQLMEASSDLMGGTEEFKSQMKASLVKSANLLTIFKHDLSEGAESNPSFIAMVENISTLSGIKTGEEYIKGVINSLKQTQLEYDLDAPIKKEQLGSYDFYSVETTLHYGEKEIHQKYFCGMSHGFSLSLIGSWTTAEERQEIEEIFKRIKV